MVHGLYNGLTSMGHGWYNTVVQRCMAHDPWDFVTFAPPMTHGKKSMNGLQMELLGHPTVIGPEFVILVTLRERVVLPSELSLECGMVLLP